MPLDDRHPARQMTDELHKIGTPMEENLLIISCCAESAERCRRMTEYLKEHPDAPFMDYYLEAQRLGRTIPLTPEEEEENRLPEEEEEDPVLEEEEEEDDDDEIDWSRPFSEIFPNWDKLSVWEKALLNNTNAKQQYRWSRALNKKRDKDKN